MQLHIIALFLDFKSIYSACHLANFIQNSPDWKGEAWYRIMPPAGTQIADSIVHEDYCGTHAPGYIKSAAHPKTIDEMVRAKVCFNWDSNTCKWSTTIKIRNCENFFIYYLVEPYVCRLRYCTI